MRTFTEEELEFARVEGIGFIAMVKRVRTREPYDAWYIVDQLETGCGYRNCTTRTYTDLAKASADYQKRFALMKIRFLRESGSLFSRDTF